MEKAGQPPRFLKGLFLAFAFLILPFALR